MTKTIILELLVESMKIVKPRLRNKMKDLKKETICFFLELSQTSPTFLA
ncbi:hypothetical protein [Streptococcus sp. HMSC078H03]|nr:hypothetical protein [Streptococcus sp. HMSC078H03]